MKLLSKTPMGTFNGQRHTKGRPAGKTPRVKIKEELPNAISQVVEASGKGDVRASIAVLQIHQLFELN